MTALACAAAVVLCAATLAPWSRATHWSVRALDFPRVQIALLCAATLALIAIFTDTGLPAVRAALAAVIACLLTQLFFILPYSRLWPVEARSATEPAGDRRLRLLTANVLTSNRQADRLTRLVREQQPDMLLTLESDTWWQARLDTLQDMLPHALKCPLDNLYGMHLYSRLPLEDAEICYLVESDVPSMHLCTTLPSGDRIRLHLLHPAPPSPTENEASDERDAELMMVARRVAESDLPVVVTGDLNDVAWSASTRLFRRVSGLLDPRVGRGMFNTFHADRPWMRWPLDHVFHSAHFSLVTLRRLPPIGSDHYPLLVELAYAPQHADDHEALEAQPDDTERAKATIAREEGRARDVPEPGTGPG